MSFEGWDRKFISLAGFISTWSKDPSTQVGAVIADADHRIVSIGFNGLPRGVADTAARLEERDVKLSLMVHAEENAILFARGNTKGMTLYSYPFIPCSNCAALIIQAGIARVVACKTQPTRWSFSFDMSRAVLKEAGLVLDEREFTPLF